MWHLNHFVAAELMKFVDQKVDPCEDFYAFACGSFEKNTIIPDDESSVDTFSLLSDELTKKLRILIENSVEKDEAHPFKLVKQLYQSCLNKSIQLLNINYSLHRDHLILYNNWSSSCWGKRSFPTRWNSQSTWRMARSCWRQVESGRIHLVRKGVPIPTTRLLYRLLV